MSTQDKKMSWSDVTKTPKKPVERIVATQEVQDKYKLAREIEEQLNHDPRFDPVVFNKPKAPVIVRQVATLTGGKNTQRQGDTDLRKIERGEIKLQSVGRDFGIKISTARASLKLTQIELNKTCSFPVGTIRDIENGTAVVTQQQVDTLRRILGIRDLIKPKPIKVKPDVIKV
jgi:hypothetical protein